MSNIFALSVSPWELIARGTIVYLGLILLVRFVLRRDPGSLSVADVLLIVIVADAAQNSMSGNYSTVSDGALLIGTLAAWNVLLDWLGYRFEVFRRLLEPPAIVLVRNGRWVRANLEREWITKGEIESKLRELGIDDIAAVKIAHLEADGEISAVRRDGNAPTKRRKVLRGTG